MSSQYCSVNCISCIRLSVMLTMMHNQVLRNQITRQRPLVPFCLRICATISDASFSSGAKETRTEGEQATSRPADPLTDNPFYEKYRSKISKLQQEQQQQNVHKHQDADKLLANDAEAQATKQLYEKYRAAEELSQTPIEMMSSSSRKTLAEIMDMEKVKLLDGEAIGELWKEYHSQKDHCVYAVMQDKEYDIMYESASKYPLFLFPLPKVSLIPDYDSVHDRPKSGYQLFLSRFKDHSFFITPLSEYQSAGELAKPTLVINHFPDFSASKHVVLLNGNYDPTSLTTLEAQCLANQIKLFYATSDHRKLLLLHAFNREPENFDYMSVIKEIDG